MACSQKVFGREVAEYTLEELLCVEDRITTHGTSNPASEHIMLAVSTLGALRGGILINDC